MRAVRRRTECVAGESTRMLACASTPRAQTNTTGTMAMLFVMMALMMGLNSAMIRIERKLLRWKPRGAYQVEASY